MIWHQSSDLELSMYSDELTVFQKLRVMVRADVRGENGWSVRQVSGQYDTLIEACYAVVVYAPDDMPSDYVISFRTSLGRGVRGDVNVSLRDVIRIVGDHMEETDDSDVVWN